MKSFPICSIITFLLFAGSMIILIFTSLEIAKPYNKTTCHDKYTCFGEIIAISKDMYRDIYKITITIYSRNLKYSFGNNYYSLTPTQLTQYNITYYKNNTKLIPMYFKCWSKWDSFWRTHTNPSPITMDTAWFERYTYKQDKPWYIVLGFAATILLVPFTLCLAISVTGAELSVILPQQQHHSYFVDNPHEFL